MRTKIRLKDVRNLFNQNDNDGIYEGVEYLFDESMRKENGLYYEEIKKLMSVKAKKEYANVIHGRIEQEEVIEYKANYCEVNYYENKHKQEVDCVKLRPCLIDSEYTVCELIEDQKVEYCEIIEDQKAKIIECCELIEVQKVDIIECCEIIEDQKVEYCEIIEDQKAEIIEDQKVEDINMLKS